MADAEECLAAGWSGEQARSWLLKIVPLKDRKLTLLPYDIYITSVSLVERIGPSPASVSNSSRSNAMRQMNTKSLDLAFVVEQHVTPLGCPVGPYGSTRHRRPNYPVTLR